MFGLQRANRTTIAVLAIVLAIVLFFAINLIASLTLRSQRLDLTEQHLFTVTPATIAVLDAIPEPITLHFYESTALVDNVPQLRVYADRVNELLRTYQQLSHGKITLDHVNPLPFSPEEDRAISYGLQGANLNRQGELGYFGLVGTNSVDQLETIKLLNPGREAFLEYDLTRVVFRLSRASEPKLGIVDGLGLFGDRQQGRQPSALIEALSENFELRSLPVDMKAVPADIDAIMVVHPYILKDQARYAIDQFVLSGKPAAIFIDPLAQYSQPSFSNPAVPQNPASDLKPLTDAWGIEMTPEKVVGDRVMAQPVVAQTPDGRRVSGDYLPWLVASKAAGSLNLEDPVTGPLDLIRMISAGELHSMPGATTTMTPLIHTSPNSMLFDEKLIVTQPFFNDLLDQFKASGQVYTLAARVTGPVKTAFPNGPPPPDPNAPPDQNPQPPTPPAEPLTESQGPINVVVVADVDMLVNRFVASGGGAPDSGNADFVINVMENLTNGNALLGLRGRGLSNRPFTLINEMEAAAQEKYRDTDQRLTNELQQIQEQLARLQQPGPANNAGAAENIAALTADQEKAIAEANQRMLSLRQQQRDVRAALRQDIDALQTKLQLFNILLIPGIVIVIGILAAVWRRVRLARYLGRRREAAAHR